jgi:hypothetical protein
MANEWRNLARTLMENLLQATTSNEAVRLIDLATIKLRAQQEALRSYRVGGVAVYVEPGPAGASPASLLEDARREIKRCSALHYLADSAIPQDARTSPWSPLRVPSEPRKRIWLSVDSV